MGSDGVPWVSWVKPMGFSPCPLALVLTLETTRFEWAPHFLLQISWGVVQFRAEKICEQWTVDKKTPIVYKRPWYEKIHLVWSTAHGPIIKFTTPVTVVRSKFPRHGSFQGKKLNMLGFHSLWPYWCDKIRQTGCCGLSSYKSLKKVYWFEPS